MISGDELDEFDVMSFTKRELRLFTCYSFVVVLVVLVVVVLP